jgi:hypothetical protein
MKVPQFLSFNASRRAFSDRLLRQAILDYVKRELAARIHKHSRPLDRLVPRPQMEIPQVVSGQVCPTDPDVYFPKPMAAIQPIGFLNSGKNKKMTVAAREDATVKVMESPRGMGIKPSKA